MTQDPSELANAPLRGDPDEVATQIAGSIQVSPRQVDNPDTVGSVEAQPHSAGWFISAQHDAGLNEQQIEEFRTYVTEQVSSLLAHGPESQLWTRASDTEPWRVDVPHSAVRGTGSSAADAAGGVQA